MGTLREQMTMDLALKRFSESTQRTYLAQVRDISIYFNKPPDKLDRDEVKKYLHYLIEEKNYSSSYVNQCYCALKFFFEITLRSEWFMDRIPCAKRERNIPAVLDQKEVLRLFKVTTNIKHKAILMLIYSSGLRVSEAANLKVSDIDSNRMMIFVRNGKGGRERYTTLSKTAMDNILQKLIDFLIKLSLAIFIGYILYFGIANILSRDIFGIPGHAGRIIFISFISITIGIFIGIIIVFVIPFIKNKFFK